MERNDMIGHRGDKIPTFLFFLFKIPFYICRYENIMPRLFLAVDAQVVMSSFSSPWNQLCSFEMKNLGEHLRTLGH